MSCNGRAEDPPPPRAQRVSIPIGFSNELQLFSRISSGTGIPVSIPIGFSNELQPRNFIRPSSSTGSFNPYRVFQ